MGFLRTKATELKWQDPPVVFSLIVVLLSSVIPFLRPIFNGLEGYGINPYAILINGFIAAGLAIAIFLIGRQKVKRKEKFGRLFILGKLDLLILYLEIITEEKILTQTGGESKKIMDSHTNSDKFKLIMKLKLFNDLKWFKDVLPVFSDVVDFDEWYPLHSAVNSWMQAHKQILVKDVHYNIMEKDEDYNTMKKIIKKHYAHWGKYKSKDYDRNYVSNPNYLDRSV